MLTTPNYALKKIELTDSPPDITVLNGNFDTIDTELKENADTTAAHLADNMKHIDYTTAAGTNTYTATLANITALTEGLSVKIKFTNACTGTSTLNINNLGAKAIQKSNGNALSNGNIKAGQICHLVYTGSVFQLLGEGGDNVSPFIAGDDVKIYYNSGLYYYNKAGTIPKKIYELKVLDGGTIRVGFTMRSDSSSKTVTARIYVNGVATGTLRSTTSISPVSYTEDIVVTANDLVQIYVTSASSTDNMFLSSLTLSSGITIPYVIINLTP